MGQRMEINIYESLYKQNKRPHDHIIGGIKGLNQSLTSIHDNRIRKTKDTQKIN